MDQEMIHGQIKCPHLKSGSIGQRGSQTGGREQLQILICWCPAVKTLHSEIQTTSVVA